MDPKSDKTAVPAPAARPSLFAAAPSSRVAAGPAQANASTSLLSAIERVDGSPARPAGSRRSPWSGGLVFMLAAAALLAGYIALSRQSDALDATTRLPATARGVPTPSATTTTTPASPGVNAQAATGTAAAAEPAAAVARLETLPGDAPRDQATAETQPADAVANAPTAPDVRQNRNSAATTRPAGELREGTSTATRGATGNASSRATGSATGSAAGNVAGGAVARATVPRAAVQLKAAERLPAVRPASAEARELMARAEALEGKAPAINNLSAPSAAPARTAPQRDPDVELVAAMMQHIEPGQAPAAATADPAVADSGPGTATTIAQLVKRCSTLADRAQRQACQERICDGYWGKAQACPATPAKPRAPGVEAAR